MHSKQIISFFVYNEVGGVWSASGFIDDAALCIKLAYLPNDYWMVSENHGSAPASVRYQLLDVKQI
jgi:hypothetical protein